MAADRTSGGARAMPLVYPHKVLLRLNVKTSQSLTLLLASLQTLWRFWGPICSFGSLCTNIGQCILWYIGQCILWYLCVLGKAPW